MPTNETRIRTSPLLALSAGATLTLGILVASRPHVSGPVASWSADDLGVVGLWWGAIAAGAWLAVTTLACLVTVGRGNPNRARRIATWAPPLVRRALQASLAGTLVLAPAVAIAAAPTAAFATPAAPIVVYVDGQGRLTTVTTSPAPEADLPVVRTPASSSNAPASTTTTTTGRIRAAVPTPATPSRPASATTKRAAQVPAPALTPAPAISGARIYIVRAGDNLWRIARAEVARATGNDRPSDAAIAPYWQQVIAANRAGLRSGNPSLIFPGEAVTLPARAAAPGAVAPAG